MNAMNGDQGLEAMLRAGHGEGVEADSERLARELAERVAASGDAEVAYATVETPVGRAGVAATARGLVGVSLPNRSLDDFVTELASGISPRVVEAPAALDEVRRQLDEYFEGERKSFDLALDWQLVPGGFYRKVLRATAALPFGVTATYGEIAGAAGNPRAHRAAGTALGSNPIPIVVPCHRIVRSGGDPGNYGGGPEMKRWLLRLEGALRE